MAKPKEKTDLEIVQEELSTIKIKRFDNKKELTLTEVLNYEDGDFYFEMNKRTGKVSKFFITEPGTNRLATESGLYHEKWELVIKPKASNRQQHVFIMQLAHREEKGGMFLHDPVIGEASLANTSSISRNYLATMAFKRAWVRAVLRALELDKRFFGSDEADEFAESKFQIHITPTELQAIAPHLDQAMKLEKKEDIPQLLKIVLSGAVNPDWAENQKRYLIRGIFNHIEEKILMKG
jgi:hypothetical protein